MDLYVKVEILGIWGSVYLKVLTAQKVRNGLPFKVSCMAVYVMMES